MLFPWNAEIAGIIKVPWMYSESNFSHDSNVLPEYFSVHFCRRQHVLYRTIVAHNTPSPVGISPWNQINVNQDQSTTTVTGIPFFAFLPLIPIQPDDSSREQVHVTLSSYYVCVNQSREPPRNIKGPGNI